MKEFYPCCLDHVKIYNRRGPMVIMPGSFNPLHDGHLSIMEHASKYTGKPVFIEYCTNNIDKATSSYDRVPEIVEQAWLTDTSVFITNFSRFVDKAAEFQRCTFVIGADTFGRIIDPKYCDNSLQALRNELLSIQYNRCDFLVYPRIIDNRLITMRDFNISGLDLRNFTDMSDNFIQYKHPFYASNISSTTLRK